ncbi:MAG: hypothetical protein QW416_07070 [Candidatus Nitrosocaldaceae archaeon]
MNIAIAALLAIPLIVICSNAYADTASVTMERSIMDVNGTNKVTLCAGSMQLDIDHILLIEGKFLSLAIYLSPFKPSIPANTCYTWNIPGDFDSDNTIAGIQPPSLTTGDWSVQIDTLQGHPYYTDFAVTTIVNNTSSNNSVRFSITPDVAPIGGSATAELCAGDFDIQVNNLWFFDPYEHPPTHYYPVNTSKLTTVQANTCYTWNIPGDFEPNPSSLRTAPLSHVGGWQVALDAEEGYWSDDFEVTIFVVPESIIGSIAITSIPIIISLLLYKRANKV